MWIRTPESRMINLDNVMAINKNTDQRFIGNDKLPTDEYAIAFIMSDGRLFRHFITINESERDRNYERLCDAIERGN